MPRVSIGLPVYNGERYLAAALDSLLAQTFGDFELIISDNASIDGTRGIAEDYARRDKRIQYLREPHNTGAVRNHNHTVEIARGEYFKWAAHDDIYAPAFIERCASILDNVPEAVLAFAKTQFIDEHGQLLDHYDHPRDFATPVRSARFLQYVFSSHVMVEDYGLIRTAILKRTPLMGNFPWSDMVLFAELALYGPFIESPDVLFFRREHRERAMQVNRDPDSLAAWNDPAKAGTLLFPRWRIIGGHLASLRRVPLPLSERIAIAGGIARRANWRRGLLIDELLQPIRGRGAR